MLLKALRKLDLDKIRAIVEQLEFLGRDWEAAGWCQWVLVQTGQLPDWARATQLRLRRTLRTATGFRKVARMAFQPQA